MKKQSLRDMEWQGRSSYQRAVLLTGDDFASVGTKLQLVKLRAGQEIKPHFHQARTEAFCVMAGNGTIRLGDEVFTCEANDFLFCPPPMIHAFQNTGQNDFIICVFRTNDPGDSDMFWVAG
jgi:quercetin dioxygenase-like cupin family protein